MKPLPYVRYDPAAALYQLLGLDQEAELAARRLRDWTWANQKPPPGKRGDLAQMAGVSPLNWTAIERQLRRKGWERRGGGFVEPWALGALRESQRAHRYWREKGAAAAAVRWGDAQSNANADAQSTPKGTASECQLKVKDKVKLSTKSLLKRSLPDSARRSGSGDLEEAPPAETPAQLADEKRFLTQVAEMCELHRPGSAGKELELWGGWWRLRYREDRDKCQRIVADIRSMIRERRLAGRPGAACFDLWQRLPTAGAPQKNQKKACATPAQTRE